MSKQNTVHRQRIFFRRPCYALQVCPPGSTPATAPLHCHAVHLALKVPTQRHSNEQKRFGCELDRVRFKFCPAGTSRPIIRESYEWHIQLELDVGLCGHWPVTSGGETDCIRNSLGDENHGTARSELTDIASCLAGAWSDNKAKPNQRDADLFAAQSVCWINKWFSTAIRAPKDATAVSRRTRKVLTHIEHTFMENQTLEDLARVAEASVFYFARIFREELGISPKQYIIRRRCAHALDRLQRTEQSIAEIAFHAGFSSQSHMTDTVRRLIGVTPLQMRPSAKQVENVGVNQ